jgi:hypothetical protein
MYLTPTTENGVAHVLNDTRQTVSSDMRMGIGKDIGGSTMLTENIENLLY